MSKIRVALPAKRRRGGQPGNINPSKNKWATFWRRRAVKAEDSWIIPFLEEYSAGLETDKPDLTAGERRMIQIAETARGAEMLILAEAAERGMIIQTPAGWDLAPGAKELGKFLNTERSALMALGLKRRSKQVDVTNIMEGWEPAQPRVEPEPEPEEPEDDGNE